MQKISPMLWFDTEAEDAANFYVSVFKDSKIKTIHHYPDAGQEVTGKEAGSVLTVLFELNGQDFTALNGGPNFKFSEAISFVIACKDQEEIDYYWDKLTAAPESEQCGWLKDKFGLSWQVIPEDIDDLIQAPKAMEAMLKMKKIIIADLKERPVKLVVTEFVSLDGVMEGPGPGDPFKLAGWTMPYSNNEFMKFKTDELKAADAQLLGRITYEGFAEAWPKIGKKDGFTKKFNEMPKYVVSSTLNKLDWENSRFVKGEDLAEEIKKLKKRAGGNLLVNGSGQLVNFLLDNKLVDELHLLVYPIVLGSGKLLFKGGDKHGLKLDKSKVFKTGVVALTYMPAKAHAKI